MEIALFTLTFLQLTFIDKINKNKYMYYEKAGQ